MEIRRSIKHLFRYIARKPFMLNLIGDIAFVYVWLIGKTCSIKTSGIQEFEDLIKDNDGGIFVAWHGRALFLPYFWSNPRTMKALVSPHADGRIIARLLSRFNILSIDGSSDRQATASGINIIKELNSGTVVSLISDGPRGPNMHLNKSVIYFAQKTGKPIMGFTYSIEKSKICKKSWDQMILPPLFSKGLYAGTKPLFVPKDISEEEIENLRQQFEKELTDLTLELDRQCGLPAITPGTTAKKRH